MSPRGSHYVTDTLVGLLGREACRGADSEGSLRDPGVGGTGRRAAGGRRRREASLPFPGSVGSKHAEMDLCPGCPGPFF